MWASQGEDLMKTIMKKMTHTISLLIAAIGLLWGSVSSATAQSYQLPDNGFEDWNGAQFDGQIQPTYWNYCNVTQFGFNFNFSDRRQGRTGYCAYVEDKDMVVIGINGGTSPGYIALGHPWAYVPSLGETDKATAGCYGGIAWTHRPDTLTVWIKRTGNNTDKENYNIVFYAWNGTAKGMSYGDKNGNCTQIPASFAGVAGGGLIDEESDIRLALDANSCQTAQVANQVCEAYLFEKRQYANWTQLRIPIYYLNDQVPEKCNLILSAGNYPAGRSNESLYAGNGLWVDDVELIYSSKIQKLYVGNREWKGFNPDAPVQTYSLGNGVTTIPDIYAIRGAGTETNNNGLSASFPGRRLSASECVITKGQVDGAPTTIVVTAEDGSSTTTYQINFVSAASNNARLADISVNGTTVSGFNAYVTTYNVALPYGTTAAPVVTADAQDGGATVVINQATSPTGTATVNVTAADGSTTQTYTLHFSVAQLTDNTLQDILIDGVSLAGFSPTKSNYTVSLPLGTTAAPTVTPVSAYAQGVQTISVTNDLTSGCVISVSVPGNSVTKNYRITYKVEASSNSSLSDLQVGGTTVTGFNPATTAYTVALPLGTTEHPAITWTAGDAYQTIAFTDGGLTAASKITVTAANGSQTVYRITFTVAQSSNCSLAGIALDGAALETFHADTLNYTVTLPAGTNIAPTVTYTAGDAFQTVTLSQGGLNGVTRITVKAGDGTTRVYTIRFQVTKSLNAFLKMIYLDGDSLVGFASSTLDYNLVLPTAVAPIVTVDKEPGQSVTISQPGSYGTARIVVQPEEGDANVYTVQFLSSAVPAPAARPAGLLDDETSPLLQDILLDGVSLAGFKPTTYSYIDTLPARTYHVPAIMPIAQTYVKEITVAYGSVNRPTRIHVVAENGIATADYQILFPVRKLDDTTLSDLTIDGVDFTFVPTQNTYDFVLPYGTTAMPTITPERRYDEQEVIITQPSALNPQLTTTATIVVNAPSGDSRTYTLNFTVAPSGLENSLQAIIVDGVGALDLTQGPNIDVVLPYQATDLVVSTTTKRYPEQSVMVTPGGLLQPTTIRVFSGYAGVNDTVYTLRPVRTLHDPASLTDLQANGTTLAAFLPHQYSYVLPVTATPTITYTPFAGATVNVTASDTKHWVAEVESADGTYSHTYTVYFYYTNDQIPSNNFNSWSNTTYNAKLKPTGWMVPADLYAKFTFLTWTHTFGDEVRQCKGTAEGYFPDASEGTSTVNLQSFFSAFTIAGTYPGIMTTGTLHMNLTTGGASTSSVDGGIVFRNTPDTVKLDSKPINSTRVNNWRFLFNVHTASGWQEHLHTGPYDNDHMGHWETNVMPLTYNGAPDSLNIIINSMHNEDMDTYNGTAADQQHCELRVRNLLLSYNSTLQSVIADGNPLVFTDRAASLTETDPEYTGVPEFLFTGQVADQEARVTWSDWTNGVRTALIRNFAEDGSYTDYTVTQTRPVSTSTAITPSVSAQNDLSIVRTSAYQHIAVTRNDTAYVIDVTAESGATQRYIANLNLSTPSTPSTTTIPAVDPIAALGSSTGLLSDISVDEVTVSGFAPTTFDYTYPTRGEYAAVRDYPLDSVFQTIRDSLVTWNVFGAADNTYNLQIALSDNAYLSNILVGGNSISGFYEQTFDYTVTTTTPTTPVPVKGHAGQTLDITTVDQGGDVYTHFIVVRAENGDKNVYTVQEIVRTPDTNALLADLRLGGTTVTGFNPTQNTYVLNQPTGYVVPDLTAFVAGVNATADIVSTLNSPLSTTFTITVTAEAGNTNVYTLTVNILPSDECHLEMIYLDATDLTGFNREVFTYNIELPVGTTALPLIDYLKSDPNSTVKLDTTQLSTATVTLTVTAEDGVSTKTYTLHFTVAKSTESHLAMIYADGTPLNGFDEDILTYHIDLPYGTTAYPALTYDKKDPNSTVKLDTTQLSTATVTLTVTAEDGVTTTTYTVTFTILPSDNALLQMIYLDGDSLKGFLPTEENYADTVPYSATSLPVVTWTLGDDQQTVVTLNPDPSTVNLVVTAGDGITTQEYTITFVREKSANNRLVDLQTSGTTVTGFQPDSLVYEMVYPVGSTTADFYTVSDIVAIPEDATATVNITQQDENTITIMVTAQNGDVRVYVIHQTITLSSNALLKMIYLDGVELPGFDPLTFDYSRLLAVGANMPNIEPVPQDTLSEVSITPGTVGDTIYIYCVAQDGTEQVYTLFFDYTVANAGDDADIDDCILVHVPGTETYMALTVRSDVNVVICDTYGQRIAEGKVPVVDPNYVRVETDARGNQYIAEVYDGAEGFSFDVPGFGKTFFAVFFSKGGTVRLAKGAKFMLLR